MHWKRNTTGFVAAVALALAALSGCETGVDDTGVEENE
ncbi:hypothetical protein ABH917_000241 [Thermobifida halotolerans]